MGSIPDTVTLSWMSLMSQLGKITEYEAIGNGFESRRCNFVLEVFNGSIR